MGEGLGVDATWELLEACIRSLSSEKHVGIL